MERKEKRKGGRKKEGGGIEGGRKMGKKIDIVFWFNWIFWEDGVTKTK